jgi:signal transduction histidine kinase
MVNLPKLVKNEYEFYKGDPRLKHMIEVKMEIQEDLPQFKHFPGDFSQSISNLFTNAVEAMENSSEKNPSHSHDF